MEHLHNPEEIVAVLGAGNGGLAISANLKLKGYTVKLFEHPSLAGEFEPVKQSRIVHLSGIGGDKSVILDVTTTDINEALADVNVINVVVPALYHDIYFSLIAPLLRSGQAIIIWAGDFGSLHLTKMLSDNGIDSNIKIVETNTLPFGARKNSYGQVLIFAEATRLIYSSNQETDTSIARLLNSFFGVRRFNGLLAAGFNNPNPLVHPPGSVLNTGRIQYDPEGFYLYKEGNTEAVLRTIYQVYTEAKQIGNAYGCEILSYDQDVFKNKLSIMGANFRSTADPISGEGTPKGPTSLNDRYFTEDIPFGLVPIAELGMKAGIEAKTIRSLIDLACVICERDFWNIGRNLISLGLDKFNTQKIAQQFGGAKSKLAIDVDNPFENA